MKSPFISVVLLNWNGKRFIDSFMEGFLKQNYPKDRMELLFVDNCSSDDSVDYFKNNYGKNKGVKIILNKKNLGYAGGNNEGLRKISGDYALVCNNDLVMEQDTIKELVLAAQKHNADVTSAKIMYLNRPGVINNAGSTLEKDSDWPIKEIGINEKDGPKYNADYEISAFCGAFILIKKSFLKTVGLFDDRFFLYFEDGDLSWRGQKKGKKYWLAASSVVRHYHTGSSEEGSPTFNHFVGRNRLLILTKNAKYRVLAKAWMKTFKEHFVIRIVRVLLSIKGKYPKKQAVHELYLSAKMILAALLLTPYALGKRYGILKENTI